MIQTILVPLDGSPFSENALPLAIDLRNAFNAQLVLVCVAGNETALDRGFTQADRRAIAEKYANITEEDHLLSTNPRMVEHAQKQVRAVDQAKHYLASMAGRLADQGVQAGLAVPYGSAVEGILTEIELHSADLVVMATRNISGLSRVFEKSVTQELISRSPVPVLVVPPERT